MAKRYFWRRFLAFLIDAFVMNIIVSIPVMAIAGVFISFGMMPMAMPDSCKPMQGRDDVVALVNLQPGEVAGYLECRSNALLRRGTTTFIVTIVKRDGKPHFPRLLTVVDDGSRLEKVDMMPGPASLLPVLAIGLAIPAAFAFFSANGRQTLGKKALGLRVKRIDDQDPMLAQALAREYWKFLPNIILAVAMAAMLLIYRDRLFSYLENAVADLDVVALAKVAAVIPVIQLSVLLWWLLPFIFWRGQTWHDRLAGTKIISVEPA